MAQIESEETNPNIDVGDGLELHPDGIVRKGAVKAKPTDAPLRYDLPFGHPLRGKRVVRNVPSGMPDCVVNDDGKLEPHNKSVAVVEEEITDIR